MKGSKPPKPNLKNKKFVNWSKAETCKQEDNIVSTEWHEKLKTIPSFLPAYGNKPVNMIYLMSGEYGRLWRKERDEWYQKVFVPKPKEKDMSQRKKKIRQQIKAAKEAAEISIRERKERRAKELEAKAKAEAEKAEKLRARVQKLKASRLPPKTPKKSKETKPNSDDDKSENKEELPPPPPPPGCIPTEQCECSSHDKESAEVEPDKESTVPEKKESEPETRSAQVSDEGACTMCNDYIKQLQEIHEANSTMKDCVEELNTENGKEEKAE